MLKFAVMMMLPVLGSAGNINDIIYRTDFINQNGGRTLETIANTMRSVAASNDLSSYFLNALIIVSILLLISNLMGITLFPNVSKMLKGTGQLIRDNIDVIRSKTGRSLDVDTLNHMANLVDQAIDAYDKYQ